MYQPLYTAHTPGTYQPEMPEKRPFLPELDIPDDPNDIHHPHRWDIPPSRIERIIIDEDPRPSDTPNLPN